jgi:DeoR family transcriptional regulator, suf operon transcriptional repressor
MQQTRKLILNILRENGDSTVESIVSSLRQKIESDITAVTVRHHLDILRAEDLVSMPAIRRSGTPGRPQHVYRLTDKGVEAFPNNYQGLMMRLLNELKAQNSPSQVNVILDGVANQMISEAGAAHLHVPLPERLDYAVGYLNSHGYEADWQPVTDGYVLRTHNCPYKRVALHHDELCGMDMRLISGLIGVVPRSLGRIVKEGEPCAYFIPHAEAAPSKP